MKLKKFIAGICAAAVSVSALAAAANAETTSFNKKVAGVPVRGSISLSGYQIVATASILDNYNNYDIFQAQVTLTYFVKERNGHLEERYDSTDWNNIGGAGCQKIIPSKERETYTIVGGRSTNNFNVNGINASYMLKIGTQNTQ